MKTKLLPSIATLLLVTLAVLVTLTASAKEVHSGNNLYVRADGGYGFSRENLTSNLNNKNLVHKTGRGGLASLGAGASITRYFSAELQFYFDQGFRTRNANTAISKALEKTLAAFVNGTLNFPNSSRFTPYVLGGAGYARNRFSVIDSNIILKSRTQNSVAWQVGIGSSFQLGKNIDLDASYRYIDKGKGKYTAKSPQAVSNSDSIRAKIGKTNALMLGIKVWY